MKIEVYFPESQFQFRPGKLPSNETISLEVDSINSFESGGVEYSFCEEVSGNGWWAKKGDNSTQVNLEFIV